MLSKIFVLVIVLVAGFMPIAARAQTIDGSYMAYPVPDYGQSVLYGSLFSRSYMERVSGKRVAKTSSPSRTHQPGANAASLSPLRYQASISEAVKRDYLKAIASSTNDKAATGLAQYYARNPVRAVFDRTVRPYGLQSTDLNDVTAGYLVAMWMTANNAGLPNAAQVRGVRTQLQAAATAPAAEAQRQRIAEVLMYETVTLLNVRETAQWERDTKALKSLADSAQQSLLKQGVDLRALALTNQGLVPR